MAFEVRGSKSGRRARVVETVFLGGARLRANIREFPPLATDEPEIAGGINTAPSPLEYLTAGLS